MKKLLLLLFLALLVGCSSHISPPSTIFVDTNKDKKIDKSIDTIVDAFDKRDAAELKSLLHKDVIQSNPNIENEINRAFDFYKGTSVKYTRNNNESTIIDDGNIQYVSYATISVETDQDSYSIHIAYNVKDKKHPEKEGIYAIKILPLSIYADYYYYAYGDSNKMNEMSDELPEEVQIADCDKECKQYGMGVFTYTKEDIMEAYYKKNGKKMMLANPSDEAPISNSATEGHTQCHTGDGSRPLKKSPISKVFK